MKCNICGVKFIYEEGVIWCPCCLKVIFRKGDSSITELPKLFRKLLKKKYTLKKLSETLGFNMYIVRVVYDTLGIKQRGTKR